MGNILGVRTDAAKETEHRLNKQRWLHYAAIKEMGEVVKVRNIVAFELETGPVFGTGAKNELNIAVSILENQVPALFERFAFPVEFEFL